MELNMEKGMADIEVNKFSLMVEAIGADTLAAIATAGPDMQVWADNSRTDLKLVYLYMYEYLD